MLVSNSPNFEIAPEFNLTKHQISVIQDLVRGKRVGVSAQLSCFLGKYIFIDGKLYRIERDESDIMIVEADTDLPMFSHPTQRIYNRLMEEKECPINSEIEANDFIDEVGKTLNIEGIDYWIKTDISEMKMYLVPIKKKNADSIIEDIEKKIQDKLDSKTILNKWKETTWSLLKDVSLALSSKYNYSCKTFENRGKNIIEISKDRSILLKFTLNETRIEVYQKDKPVGQVYCIGEENNLIGILSNTIIEIATKGI